MKFSRVGKCEETIKFDKVWGYQNEGVPLKRGRQNLKFLANLTRHIIFARQANMTKRKI